MCISLCYIGYLTDQILKLLSSFQLPISVVSNAITTLTQCANAVPPTRDSTLQVNSVSIVTIDIKRDHFTMYFRKLVHVNVGSFFMLCYIVTWCVIVYCHTVALTTTETM